jgi:hypothetical protein
MDTFLYGAAFYEEYMPEDRLDKDVELMQHGASRAGQPIHYYFNFSPGGALSLDPWGVAIVEQPAP